MNNTIHAWIRNDDETFRHLTFLDLTISQVAETLRGNNVIAIIDESLMVECEFTYEQPSNPYNKTIWWYRPRAEANSNSRIINQADVDKFLADLDTLGEE